jgi:hypothetical protein
MKSVDFITTLQLSSKLLDLLLILGSGGLLGYLALVLQKENMFNRITTNLEIYL